MPKLDLDFVIVVNDNGEMKTITRAELEKVMPTDPDGMPALDIAINTVLDNRAFGDEIASAAGAE